MPQILAFAAPASQGCLNRTGRDSAITVRTMRATALAVSVGARPEYMIAFSLFGGL